MPTFVDDFERANGPLGGNWVTTFGAPAVSGGVFVGPASCGAYNTTVSGGDYMEATATVYSVLTASARAGPSVKAIPGGTLCWVLHIKGSSAPYTLCLTPHSDLNLTPSYFVTLATTPPPVHTLRLVWDHGHLSGYLNGVLLIQADTGLNAGGSYGGGVTYAQQSSLANIQIVSGSAVGLSVSPSVLGNYGQCVSAVLTGTNTAWTPGDPGSPIFTVDHGSISHQVVTDASHATIIYCPGDFLGAVTFADPSTGATATAIVTSDPVIVPPGGTTGDTWSPYKTLVDATGTLNTPDYLLTDQSPVIESSEEVPGRLAILDAIRQIWNAHFGMWTGSPPSVDAEKLDKLWYVLNGHNTLRTEYDLPYDEPIASTLKKALDVWLAPGGATLNTSQNILDAIAGISGASDTQVRADLGVVGQTAHESILSTLLELQGVGAYTLTDLAEALDAISSNGSYSLGSVLSAIAAIAEPDLSPVTSKLALIQPSTAYSLTTLAAQCASLLTSVVAIKTELDEVRALVEALEIPAASGMALPLWPGEAKVTLGASHALTNGLVVAGPMHGLLLTITAHPDHNTRYLFGEVSSWARVGQVVFSTDRGDYERSQSFSMDAQVMVPMTMETADAATVKLNSGWAGTVRAWSRV